MKTNFDGLRREKEKSLADQYVSQKPGNDGVTLLLKRQYLMLRFWMNSTIFFGFSGALYALTLIVISRFAPRLYENQLELCISGGLLFLGGILSGYLPDHLCARVARTVSSNYSSIVTDDLPVLLYPPIFKESKAVREIAGTLLGRLYPEQIQALDRDTQKHIRSLARVPEFSPVITQAIVDALDRKPVPQPARES